MNGADPTWRELQRLMTIEEEAAPEAPRERVPLEEIATLAALAASSSRLTGLSSLDLAGLARTLGVERAAAARRLGALRERGYLAILPARNGRHIYRLLSRRSS